MPCKTMVLPYQPKAIKMAAAIDKKANGTAHEGWEPATFSVTLSAKAILVFRRNENDAVK